MKLENSALDEKGFIEKSLSIETLDNGTFKITAKEIPVGKKEEQIIDLSFTKNGLAALLGSWMVIGDKSKGMSRDE